MFRPAPTVVNGARSGASRRTRPRLPGNLFTTTLLTGSRRKAPVGVQCDPVVLIPDSLIENRGRHRTTWPGDHKTAKSIPPVRLPPQVVPHPTAASSASKRVPPYLEPGIGTFKHDAGPARPVPKRTSWLPTGSNAAGNKNRSPHRHLPTPDKGSQDSGPRERGAECPVGSARDRESPRRGPRINSSRPCRHPLRACADSSWPG